MMTGKFEWTNNAGFAANFNEECNLEEARQLVLQAFPEAVEYDANDAIWFYRNEDAYDRDQDNADHNRGVVATWEGDNQ
jgi:hypothetical protein